MSKQLLSSVYTWIICFELISILIGFVSGPSNDLWYESLKKSDLTPPGYVFGIIWPILYLNLAIFTYRLHNRKIKIKSKNIEKYFWLQMIINWFWSPIFLNLHLINCSLFAFFLNLILAMLY